MQPGASMQSRRPKINSGILLFALLLLQAGLVIYLATPYRLFPSDDLNYYVEFMSKKGGLLQILAEEQHPFYLLYFWADYRLLKWLAAPLGQPFIVAGLVANTITLACLVRLAHHYTRKLGWTLLVGLLFITSAWTNNYYYFFSYTPLPTALLVLAFTLLLPSLLPPEETPGRGKLRPFWAGAILGLAFWSAPAALVMIGLLLSLPLLCHFRTLRQTGLPLGGRQFLGFLSTFTPFALLSLPSYRAHIAQNIATNHYADAFAKFGYIPKPPFFTFLRILREYSLVQAGLTVAVSLGLGYWLLNHFRSRASLAPELRQARPQLPTPLLLGGLLLFLGLTHTLVIDLLPSTKLGRTHFQYFPFLLLLLVIPPAAFLARLSARLPRKIATAGYGGLLCLSLLLAAEKSLETRILRQAAPEYLASQEVEKIYLLKEDPHADSLENWFSDTRVEQVAERQIDTLIAQEISRGVRGMLILGPSGPGSGNSILQHSTLPDFDLNLPKGIEENITYLPYYSFYPPFLLEEEICQALYWAGKIPNQNTEPSSLKVLHW